MHCQTRQAIPCRCTVGWGWLASSSLFLAGYLSLLTLDMAESIGSIISGWGLSQESTKFESTLPDIDLDNSEDLQLTRAENSERFGAALSERVIDQAIVSQVL